jgi:hypothetical protein
MNNQESIEFKKLQNKIDIVGISGLTMEEEFYYRIHKTEFEKDNFIKEEIDASQIS